MLKLALEDVVLFPMMTEKSNEILSKKKYKTYCFKVAVSANKPLIKRSLESQFGVKILKINTIYYKGVMKQVRSKKGFVSSYSKSFKKAFVTLKSGSFPFFDAVASNVPAK